MGQHSHIETYIDNEFCFVDITPTALIEYTATVRN